MKRLLIFLLALAATLPLGAQRPRDFAVATDSLQQRMKRRTGVDCRFRLEKLQQRGETLDFYYSQNLSGYPWRAGDVAWFREQLQDVGKAALGGNSGVLKEGGADIAVVVAGVLRKGGGNKVADVGLGKGKGKPVKSSLCHGA